MNFYSYFCQNRLKNLEERLVDMASMLEVEDDDQIDAEGALTNLAAMMAEVDLCKGVLTTMAAAQVYKIGQTYQTIDAVEQLDYEQEAEGLAEIGKAAAAGAYQNFTPAPIGIGHGYSHPAYPRIISRVPVRHLHRIGPEGLFNGCLYVDAGRSLFTCRTKGFPSRTYIYSPADDVLFANPREFTVPSDPRYSSVEDLRMFTHEGKTLASFTRAGQTEKGWVCKMFLGEIGENLDLTWLHGIDSPHDCRVEKNWVFFSCGGKLFCVYYPAPHIVYQIDWNAGVPSLGQKWEAENWLQADFMENARGGASPVRIGDEFYHFYHTQHRHGRGTAYQVGLYTFEACPPWNVSRIVKGPLLSMVPSKRDLDCIFPCGAYLSGEQWVLSCGIQDHETMAIALHFKDVESLLAKV